MSEFRISDPQMNEQRRGRAFSKSGVIRMGAGALLLATTGTLAAACSPYEATSPQKVSAIIHCGYTEDAHGREVKDEPRRVVYYGTDQERTFGATTTAFMGSYPDGAAHANASESSTPSQESTGGDSTTSASPYYGPIKQAWFAVKTVTENGQLASTYVAGDGPLPDSWSKGPFSPTAIKPSQVLFKAKSPNGDIEVVTTMSPRDVAVQCEDYQPVQDQSIQVDVPKQVFVVPGNVETNSAALAPASLSLGASPFVGAVSLQ